MENPSQVEPAPMAVESEKSAAYYPGFVCPSCGYCCGEEEENTARSHVEELQPHFLSARNLFAILAALLFALALLLDENQLLLRAIAYGLGAIAYLGEILAITSGFRKKTAFRELLMPYLFGFMYVVLGISYVMEHLG